MPRTKTFDEAQTLEKAMNLFWERGFHNTSMQDLVDHLGLSRSSIYDTFEDKSGLFLASLQLYREKYTDPRDQHVGTVASETGSMSLETFLHGFFKALIRQAKGEESKGCFMVNTCVELAPHDGNVREIVQANMSAFVGNFTELFRAYQSTKVISEEKDPAALANFLYATVSGLKVISRTTDDRQVLEDIAKTATEAILN